MYILQIERVKKFGDITKTVIVNQQYFIEEEKSKAEELLIRLNAHFCESSPARPAEYKAVLLEVK